MADSLPESHMYRVLSTVGATQVLPRSQAIACKSPKRREWQIAVSACKYRSREQLIAHHHLVPRRVLTFVYVHDKLVDHDEHLSTSTTTISTLGIGIRLLNVLNTALLAVTTSQTILRAVL